MLCCNKTYKYNTQADIQNFQYHEILLLNPDDINPSIETEIRVGSYLSDNQTKALNSLLKFKKTLDEKNAPFDSGCPRFLTKTLGVFNLAPFVGNSEINVLVDTKLTYISGNSIIVTSQESPLQTKFEATVSSYNYFTGMLIFTNIVNLVGTWTADTRAIINLDGIDGPQGPTGFTGPAGPSGPTVPYSTYTNIINTTDLDSNNCYNITRLSDASSIIINNLDTRFLSTISGSTVRAMCAVGTNLYIGGGFTTFNNGTGNIIANRICKYDTITSTFATLGNGFNSDVYTICAVGTNLYIGGDFTTFNNGTSNITTNYICKYDTITSTFATLGNGVGSAVRAMCAIGTNLYIVGFFTTFNNGTGNITTNNICKYDTITSTFSTLGNGVGGVVYTICAIGTNLYIGGGFTTFNNGTGDITANRICKYDTITSTFSTLGNGVNYFVQTICAIGTNLYIGGDFSSFNNGSGDITANRICKYDTITSTFSTLGNGVNSGVNTIYAVGTNLYIGGDFSSFNNGSGNITANRICKYDTITSTVSTLGNGFNSVVRALCNIGTNLYIGGSFATFNNGSNVITCGNFFDMRNFTEIKYNNISIGFMSNKKFEVINSTTYNNKTYITFLGKKYII